jgi:hypothetical protein
VDNADGGVGAGEDGQFRVHDRRHRRGTCKRRNGKMVKPKSPAVGPSRGVPDA